METKTLDNLDLRKLAIEKIANKLENYGLFFNPSKEFPELSEKQGKQLHSELSAIIKSIYRHMGVK